MSRLSFLRSSRMASVQGILSLGAVCVMLADGTLVPASLRAQDRPASRTVPVRASGDTVSTSGSSSSIRPNSVAADTGRMTWGRQDYGRYSTAVACDRAIGHMRLELMRTRSYDTISYSLESDTVPTPARVVGQTCGTRFTVEGTHPHELWSLFRIALAVNDDAKANAVIERQLSLAKTLTDSASRMENGIALLMTASPPRLAAAQTLLQRLDALGAPAKRSQYAARVTILDYWKTLYNRDSIRAYANAAIAQLQSMTVEERNVVDDVFTPYDMLFDLANEVQDLAAQEKLLDQALTDVGSWREGASGNWTAYRTGLLETRKSLYGKRTRPLEGTYWFNTGGTPRPAAGKLSLLVRVSHTCGEDCFPLYVLIRQLKAQYGDALDITLITETRGFARGTGPISPAEEAKKASEYFLEFLKLPVGLLMDEVPFTKRSDGKISWQTSPIGEMFAGWQGANAVLVDQTSTIRWIGGVQSHRDKLFVIAAIDRVVKNQPATGSAAATANTAP